ncbi:hypothetical protein FACS1894187_15980 [Synergistales bacterium]|nr:hypothetical protein FACS1894187_15980 [Synergistales bacterium]
MQIGQSILNKMTLYHGTIYDFNTIDINRGKPNKDFGRGFYTSRVEQHAVSLAKRNKLIEETRLVKLGRRLTVTAWLYTYEFDMINLEALSVRDFKTADHEWVKFVTKNRASRAKLHDYDIIIGPTANDDTNATIGLYMLGAYGDIDSEEAIDTFLRLILPERLPPQIFFGSQKATDTLVFQGRRQILW